METDLFQSFESKEIDRGRTDTATDTATDTNYE
jgi:hypothetical protein